MSPMDSETASSLPDSTQHAPTAHTVLDEQLDLIEREITHAERFEKAKLKLADLRDRAPSAFGGLESRIIRLEREIDLAKRLEKAEIEAVALSTGLPQGPSLSLCVGLFLTGGCLGLVAGLSEHEGISTLLLTTTATFAGGVFLGRQVGSEKATSTISLHKGLGWYLTSFSGGLVFFLVAAAFARTIGIPIAYTDSTPAAELKSKKGESEVGVAAVESGGETEPPPESYRQRLTLRGEGIGDAIDSLLSELVRLKRQGSYAEVTNRCDAFLDPRILAECSNAYSHLSDVPNDPRSLALDQFRSESLK